MTAQLAQRLQVTTYVWCKGEGEFDKAHAPNVQLGSMGSPARRCTANNLLIELRQLAVHPNSLQHAAATISRIRLPAQPHPLLQLEVLPGSLQVQGRADLDGVERGGTALVDSGCSRERMFGLSCGEGAVIECFGCPEAAFHNPRAAAEACSQKPASPSAPTNDLQHLLVISEQVRAAAA